MTAIMMSLEKQGLTLPGEIPAPSPALSTKSGKEGIALSPYSSSPSQSQPVRQKWYQWYSPTDTPAERRLIRKLDALIIVFCFLAYWVKVLDSSALSTAYVSGMKESLGLYGNELNYLGTVYMVGFITLQIPLTLLMTKVPAQYVLPGADLVWGVFTLVQYKATSVNQLYAFRFFIGATGGFFFPAVHYLLGSWYKRSELSRRGAIFFIASQVGSMSSGYIQAGAHANLNGKNGLEGWRWLFIICFACTIPIAILGFVFLPGTPDKPSHFRFLTEEEVELAKARMAAEHREPSKPWTLPMFKRILSGWHFWVLVIFAFFFSQADGISSQSGLPLWLKEMGKSVEDINTITTVLPAVTIVFSIAYGVLNDAYDIKISLIALTAVLNIFAAIVLAIWDVPIGLKYFAFFLSGTANAIASLIYAWANEICAGSAEERALVLSSMNTLGNTMYAWLPIFLWPTVEAPRYLKGYIWTIALDVSMIAMLIVLRFYVKREKKEKAAARAEGEF